MKNHKIDPEKIFLSDFSGREMLKEMIYQKAKDYGELLKERKKFLESDVFSEVNDEIRPYFLEKVAELKFPISEIERDLRNMCFTLNKSETKIPQITEWEFKFSINLEFFVITVQIISFHFFLVLRKFK